MKGAEIIINTEQEMMNNEEESLTSIVSSISNLSAWLIRIEN
jgi:hypothetical protein